jgi:hypothetical protein
MTDFRQALLDLTQDQLADFLDHLWRTQTRPTFAGLKAFMGWDHDL